MHSGLVHSLEEVVAFFNRGGDAPGSYVGKSVLAPLGLTGEEQADLVSVPASARWKRTDSDVSLTAGVSHSYPEPTGRISPTRVGISSDTVG